MTFVTRTDSVGVFNFFPFVKQGLRLLTGLLVLAVIVCSAPQDALAKAKKNSGPNPRYAAIVIDYDTGAVLHQNNADKSLHPASLAKIMTLLLTFDALERGEIGLRDYISVSTRAAGMSPSKLGLKAGSSIRVEDAIYALVTKSANDIAVALAEKIGGTESQFAKRMTARALEIGMTRTRFTNASGLPDARQVTSAHDMAKLARYVIRRHPQYYHYFSTQNFTYKGVSHHNHNRLMSSYRGMDGLKTGFIGASGFNLVASAKRGNKRLIGVVFGGNTATSRNAQMTKLLDAAFSKNGADTLVAMEKAPIPPRKPAEPVSATQQPAEVKWADLKPILKTSAFSEMMGEGDADPDAARRLEAGVAAMSAHNGLRATDPQPLENPPVYEASFVPPADGRSWAIQIGTFSTRVRTDTALSEARRSLPSVLAFAAPAIAPLKTREGWLFRGRLNGYTRSEAMRACRYLKDCLPVSPQTR